jgi:hypothetical protein
MIWFFKIALDILGSLAAVLLAPFVCLFANKYRGDLPRGFRWMQTPDVKLPGDFREPLVASLYKRFGFYLTSVYWVGWRNKAYGLSSRLAYRPKHGEAMSYTGNPNVGDDGAERGYCLFVMEGAWEFYAVYGRRFGIRVRLGHKLQPFFQNANWSNPLWGMPVLHLSLRKLG